MPNCTSCGSPTPEGQGSSCSMCMGDISHGTDGYYEDWARQQQAQEERRRQDELEYERMMEQKQQEENEQN